MNPAAIDKLGEFVGLGTAYHDYRGELRRFSAESKAALLTGMGFTLANDDAIARSLAELERRQSSSIMAPVHVIEQRQEAFIECYLPASTEQLIWTLQLEARDALQGGHRVMDLESAATGDIRGRSVRLPLPADLPAGYHRYTIRTDTNAMGETTLIVAPARCYDAPVLQKKIWGLTLQLYTLRTERNWGMGDLGDLREVIDSVAPLGCNLIGLNPLHALRPAAPTGASPYSPSSRQFLNVLYIAVPDIPEYDECSAAQELVQAATFQVQLRALKEKTHVDYAGVARLKLTILEELFEHFREHHLRKDTQRGVAFRDHLKSGGRSLLLHATFDALDRRFRRQNTESWGWPSWPESYRDPDGRAVKQYVRQHRAEVEFFAYLQWIAAQQLENAQRYARHRGMSPGLYGDVAVGVAAGGSETWANRSLYVTQAGIGAPPDPLALKGQDWGIPPQNPVELKAQRYQPYIEMLRANMRHVGALRLDHVMALFRQWWVPRGYAATEGVYMHYPLDDLMHILALESRRHECIVIGEDLGTVPDAVRHAMQRYAVAHYKVLLFERESDGRFKTPGAYQRHALAAVTTHDLPTFRGWWQGADIDLGARLDLFPDADTQDRLRRERARDRRLFMSALVEAGLWYWQSHEPLPEASHALVRAAHLFLGLSNSALAVMQIEDLAGMSDPVNVPGTSAEYPNWQRKITSMLKDILADRNNRELLAAMSKARAGINPNT